MLRIIHAQTVSGGILIDDIDDGLPNKEVYRIGSHANPKALLTDGYANRAKQPCYVPRTKPTNAAIAGYIDLNQTQRVDLSAGKGKIFKLKQAGLVTVVSFVASDLAAPTITSATLNSPGAGDLTLVTTKALSVAPNISSVTITGSGAKSLTSTQITGGGATFPDTSIVIPAALIPSVAATTSSISLTADDQTSSPRVVA